MKASNIKANMLIIKKASNNIKNLEKHSQTIWDNWQKNTPLVDACRKDIQGFYGISRLLESVFDKHFYFSACNEVDEVFLTLIEKSKIQMTTTQFIKNDELTISQCKNLYEVDKSLCYWGGITIQHVFITMWLTKVMGWKIQTQSDFDNAIEFENQKYRQEKWQEIAEECELDDIVDDN